MILHLVISFISGFFVGGVIAFLFHKKVSDKAFIRLIEGLHKLGIITINSKVLFDKLAKYGSIKELTKRVLEVSE